MRSVQSEAQYIFFILFIAPYYNNLLILTEVDGKFLEVSNDATNISFYGNTESLKQKECGSCVHDTGALGFIEPVPTKKACLC